MEPFVRIQNVSYTHWNQSQPTLKNVSLALQPGSLNVLVGPGGSGKSTLCGLFNGLIPHILGGKLEGDVWIGGVNTRAVEVKDLAHQVGYVFQDPESMFATLYVEDEIAFGPENLKFEVGVIRKTVEELLQSTQLMPFRHNLVWNLSGGQVQKLGLAVILAMKPKLVILDEPTSNLDPAATRSVHELILSLRRQGITVLLVTRDLDEFLSEADQLLVMADGAMLACDTPQRVLYEHGQELVHSLGIWLPETAEIGIALKENPRWQVDTIPIQIPEALALFDRNHFRPAALSGKVASIQERPAGEPLISARQLRFSYNGKTDALKDVSLDIRAGEMLAIVGRNGAGKSTLAKLVVGLLKPQQGDLQLFGKPAHKWKVQDLANKIALVFQNPEHQFLTDTVADEIGYSLLAHGISGAAEIQAATERYLKMLGLMEVKTIHPFALSAGMKRRLGVATMLVGEPAVLLVDEPTYGQDKQMTHTLMQRMQEIRSQGIAVVMITHDMRLVQEYASRVVVMSEGQVLYDGDPGKLFEMDDVLEKANLHPTILHHLLLELQRRGAAISGEIRTTQDFLAALLQNTSTGGVQ